MEVDGQSVALRRFCNVVTIFSTQDDRISSASTKWDYVFLRAYLVLIYSCRTCDEADKISYMLKVPNMKYIHKFPGTNSPIIQLEFQSTCHI